MKRFIILPLVIVLGVFVSFDGLRAVGPLALQEEAGEETSRAEAIRANFDKIVSEDKEVKREALLYFGKVDKAFAAEVPLFTAALKDERTQVRAISAYALGKIGIAAVGSIAEVEKLLTDSSATVQRYAKRALERLQPLKPAPKKPMPEEAQAPKPTPGELIDKLRVLGWKVKTDKNGVVVGMATRSLIDLNLRGTKVSVLVHLRELPELRELSLEHCSISGTGWAHLEGLKKLRKLDLFYSPITDAGLAYLKGLTELEDLKLVGELPKVTDAGLVHLRRMTKLKRLDLGTRRITNAGVAHLRGLTEMETLFLPIDRITNAGLGYLKGMRKLKELHLRPDIVGSSQISNAGLKYLKGLTKLEYVWIAGSRVTDSGGMWLKKALPDCKIAVTWTSSGKGSKSWKSD